MGCRTALLLAVVLSLAPASRAGADAPGSICSSQSAIRPIDRSVLARRPGTSSIPFEPNRGQTDPSVRYLARGTGFALYLTDLGAVFSTLDGGVLRMSVKGENPAARFGEGIPLSGVSNYFMGNDRSKWQTGVPHLVSVARTNVLARTDLRWRGDRGAIEYEAIIGPGGRERAISFEVEGALALVVEPSGGLRMDSLGGTLRQSPPRAFQESNGRLWRVPARFVTEGACEFRLEAGPCDPTLPLVIDPQISFSTYFGSTGFEFARQVAVDGSGNIYLAGRSDSIDFPVKNAFQATSGDAPAYTGDAVLVKFDSTASNLIYSTYLGGAGLDEAQALAVSSTGTVWLLGGTTSTNFPTLNPFQASNKGSVDGFLTKVNSTGASLAYSTYFGGSDYDAGVALAVDSTGAAYVTGDTKSSNFPLQSPFQPNRNGGALYDTFVLKMNAGGTALNFSTYLGGSGDNAARGIAVDASGNIVVCGRTNASNFPLVNPLQSTIGGGYDGFVTRFNATGGSLSFSTFLGGSGDDACSRIRIDSNGALLLAGGTYSANFPTASAYQSTIGGSADAFVTKMKADGSSLIFSTFLGGSNLDGAGDLAIGSNNTVFVSGNTYSTNFPTVAAVQGSSAGNQDGFLSRFSSDGSTLLYSTYFGGSGTDTAQSVAVFGSSPILYGETDSSNLTTVSPYQSQNRSPGQGVRDFFLVMLTNPLNPPSALGASNSGNDAASLTWTDASNNESGFQVERMVPGGAFQLIASVGADATAYVDTGLSRGVTYTYRVRAVNLDGGSSYSNEASVTTPPTIVGIPLTPTSCVATLMSTHQVDLAWSDNSNNEDFFQVQRRIEDGLWQVRSTPGPNSTTYSDTGVLPDRDYAFRVRAGNSVGFSDVSEVALISTPATLDIQVQKGSIKASPTVAKASVKLSGTLSYEPDADHAAFDPSNQSFTLWLGTAADMPLLAIISPAEGWTLKRGKYTWKSPKGSITKAKVVVNTVTSTWTAKLSKLTLPAPPTNPLRVTLSLGTDTGHHEVDWTPPTSKGLIKFPVPVPKER